MKGGESTGPLSQSGGTRIGGADLENLDNSRIVRVEHEHALMESGHLDRVQGGIVRPDDVDVDIAHLLLGENQATQALSLIHI